MRSIPLGDAVLTVARLAAVEPVPRLIQQPQADGSLRSDVAFREIGLVCMRLSLSRPLPQGFSRDLDSSLAHHHLALVLACCVVRPKGRHRSADRT